MALPACGFAVYADKAGQLPLAIERRAKGKRVTVINGVKGNARALCQSLTTLLGVGGTVHSKGQLFDVEVQGEQTERVSSALRQLACVRGPGGVKLKEPAVVERSCGYDEFLRQDRPEASGRRKERWDAGPREPPEPPENAPCRAWHGHWIYCNGHCEELDNSLIWDEEVTPVPTQSIAPLSPSQLDLVLKRLGLMAAVGAAVESYRLELQTARAERAQPKASFCAVQPPKEPAAVFTCGECGASFTMRRTLELHKRNHQNSVNSISSTAGPEVAAWRWDSMSQARQEADFISESLPEKIDFGALAYDDEFLSPEEAQYLVPETSKYTLGSLLDHAVPVVRNRPRKKGRAATYRPCPVCDVEFPESALEQHVEECLQLNESSQAASPSRAKGSMATVETEMVEALPEELLESLLQLQLPPEASDVFWSTYEFHLTGKKGNAVHDAFLKALEEALTWIPEGAGSSEDRNYELPERSQPTMVKSVQDASAPTPSSGVQVTCPVCGLDFPSATIEVHVDQCLGSQAETAQINSSGYPNGNNLSGVNEDDKLPQVADDTDTQPARKSRWTKPRAEQPKEPKEDLDAPMATMPRSAVQSSPEDALPAESSDLKESAQDRISRLKREAKARKAKTAR